MQTSGGHHSMCLEKLDPPVRSLSKDAFDQQIIANRGFIEDAAKLPGAHSFRASSSQNPIPAAVLGAHINEAISGPGNLPSAEDGNVALEVTDLLYAERRSL
jgi:hypothetical protein